MRDDPLFDDRSKPSLLFVEVKSGGPCRLNGPWTDRRAGNITRVLSAVGCYPPTEVETAADALYGLGSYEGDGVDATLVAVARQHSDQLAQVAPGAVQLLWDEILRFILDRFDRYHRQKAHHPQWDSPGRQLYDLAAEARGDFIRFKQSVDAAFF
jgi:hypothetical protein